MFEAYQVLETNDDRAKQQETAKLQSLAKITPQQAKQSAEAALGGKASHVKLENEDGNLVYTVVISPKEAKVDAGNSKVLYTEALNHKNKKTEASHPRSSIQVMDSTNNCFEKISRRNSMNKVLSRVPEVTLPFWIVKVLATTVGETGADFLSATLNLGLGITSYVMSGVLLIALLNQFRLKRYVPVSYWIVVIFMSVTGTLITDRLVNDFGVSLVTTTIIFGTVLSVVFAFWYVKEKTLAMHSISTARRELFYWVAILFTFALGTATGDLIAEFLKLGYAQSVLIFGASIAAITIGYHYFKMNAVLAFWMAYILTRPLGASVGDLLSQPTTDGGFGWGTVGTSMVFLSIILSLVIYLSFKQKKPALSSIE